MLTAVIYDPALFIFFDEAGATRRDFAFQFFPLSVQTLPIAVRSLARSFISPAKLIQRIAEKTRAQKLLMRVSS